MVQCQCSLRYGPSCGLSVVGLVAGPMVSMRMANVSRLGGNGFGINCDTPMHIHRAAFRNVRIHPDSRTRNPPQLDCAKAWTSQESNCRRKAVTSHFRPLAER